jgi:hypothetical protein
MTLLEERTGDRTDGRPADLGVASVPRVLGRTARQA